MSANACASPEKWNQMYKDGTLPFVCDNWKLPCIAVLKEILCSEKNRSLANMALLDYGCGPGAFFGLYNELKVGRVKALDSSDIAVDQAKKAAKNTNVEVQLADIVPQDERYDIVVFWGVAHHLEPERAQDFIEKFFNIMKDGGLLIFSGWSSRHRRFVSQNGISEYLGTQTYPIDDLIPYIKRYFKLEKSDCIKDASQDYDYYVFRRKKQVEYLQDLLKDCIEKYINDIIFYHFIDYSISSDFTRASIDNKKSLLVYDKSREKAAREIFGTVVNNAKKHCAGKTLSSEIYSENQRDSFVVEYNPEASEVEIKKDKDKIRVTFKNMDAEAVCNGNTLTSGDEHGRCETSIEDFCKDIENLRSKDENFVYKTRAREPGKVKQNSSLLPNDIYNVLYYGLNVDRRLYFYCFVNNSVAISGKSIGDGGLVVYTEHELNEEALSAIEMAFLRWSSALSLDTINNILHQTSTKSAIAAIMSRNGSHNIGSHVLAAMSHRLSNQFDNQTLYHYIQDRMAYVAMAATDFPTWRQPTLVYNQLLKGFFAQRQLLRHISESEGFSDFVVVKPEEALPDPLEKGKIYFKVTGCAPDSDLSVAIPGGLVGNHAFYTILENVIRNAAKHEKPESLVVHIEVSDKKDKVEFFVWTPTNEDKENLIMRKMQEGLLRDDGSLRRGNWGLSEMRISAAFLAGDEKHIIHLDDIKPCSHRKENNVDGFGYKFYIEKPKELLVVKKAGSKWNSTDYASNGIKVISLEELKKEKTAFPYSYVLFEDKVECKEKLPLRVLEASEVDNYATLSVDKLLSAVCDAWKEKVVKERLVDKSLNVTVNLTGDDAGIATSDSDDSERVLFILTDPSFDDLSHRFNAYNEALDQPIDDIDALDGIWHLRSDAVVLQAVKEELGGGNKYIANVLAKALCKAQKLANSNLKCSEDTLRKFLAFLKHVIFAELQTTEASTSVSTEGEKTFGVSNGKDVFNARFIRHGSAMEGDYYFEPLSGAQNTFSFFRDYVSKDSGAMFEARLVETAAMKILVADERVHDYVSRHPGMNDVLEKMHIKVIDKAPRIKDIKNSDIAIIHLGVIDKRLKGGSTRGSVKVYIDRLEKCKRTDVILTTGRGHPDNIPESARVLPYPTVDHTLLQNHPDKMTLLDAVLRVLPGKGGR